MSTPYMPERCDHVSNSWLPPTDDAHILARNYTNMHQRRVDPIAAGNVYVSSVARVSERARHRAELRRCFDQYADEWRAQTVHLSVLSQRVMHPSYQRIIGLGQEALPLIMERLLNQPDHWFWALRSISGEDPASPEEVGRFGAMRDAWIDWGRDRGLIR